MVRDIQGLDECSVMKAKGAGPYKEVTNSIESTERHNEIGTKGSLLDFATGSHW